MRIAVTGATGFVGRHVLSALQEMDHQIVVIARGCVPRDLPGYRQIPMDIQDVTADMFELLGCPDLLIHLAWGGLPNYQSEHHIDLEAPRAFQFIKTLVQSGLESVVVAGTCAEYGNLGGELTEKKIGEKQNKYALAKLSLFNHLTQLQKDYSFKLTWPRMFYMYGDGQSDNSLLAQLGKAAYRGDPVFNMSGGLQKRDYLSVDTVAKYIVDLSLLNTDIGLVNICSGKAIAILDLVEEFLAVNRLKISLNTGYYPYPENEAMVSWGSTDKLFSLVKPRANGSLMHLGCSAH